MNIKRAIVIGTTSVLAVGGVAAMAAPAMADDNSDVVQAVGMPASGSCSAVSLPALNWAGVQGDGWTAGWGEWLNGGKGGQACVRTLTYNNSTQTWSVVA